MSDDNVGKNGCMVTEVSGSFIVQYIAGSDLFREAKAYEQVIILERMFAARARKSLLFNLM
jgi:hypothetical protein